MPPTPPRSLETAADVETFVRDVLLAPTRTHPVFGITAWPRDRVLSIDPARLAAALGDRPVELVTIQHPDALAALVRLLPFAFAKGGAVRLWWPGLTAAPCHRDAHPLRLVMPVRDEAQVIRELVAQVAQGPSRKPFAPVAPFRPAVVVRPTVAPAAAPRSENRELVTMAVQVVRREREAMEAWVETEQLRQQLEQVERARKETARQLAEARRRTPAAEEAPPAPTETQDFLTGVRIAYAKLCGETDRFLYPLASMRLGRSFLASVEALQGVSLDKVQEVCAQVACGLAPKLAGREVHTLTVGPRGSSQVVRASDGAKAWRCALQRGTPNARRLHWWEGSDERGRFVEFGSVGGHDELTIPE